MRVDASPEAVEHIRQQGDRLYVWAHGAACCGGTRFIESSTRPPDDLLGFLSVEGAGFELYVRPAAGLLPDEVQVTMKGWRRPRVEAYWNGCAYLV